MRNNLKKTIFTTVFVLGIYMMHADIVVAEAVEGEVSYNQLPNEEEVQNQLPNEEDEQSIMEEEASGIVINATNFPDENFRQYLKDDEWIDENHDGYLSIAEIEDTTFLYVSDLGIESLKGIEFFSCLKSLYCNGNYLNSLDLSGNKALTSLSCWDNYLQSLDICMLSNLTYLHCGDNQLKSLNLSSNLKLETVQCSNNELTTLDVKKLKSLQELECNHNQIRILDLSQNTKLETLYCYHNAIKSLDLSGNASLISLDCSNNYISWLNIDSCKSLESMTCDNNQLTSLNTVALPRLKRLNCGYNMITNLDLSKNPYLTNLSCSYCGLTTLDLSHNRALTDISIYGNALPCLDVSMLSKLSYFGADGEIYSHDISIDMAQFPGFDMSKVSDINYMSTNGTTLTFDKYQYLGEYHDWGYFTYDCGNGWEMEVDVRRKGTTLSPIEKQMINNFVVRLYDVCLERIPDEAGLEDWTEQLKNKERTGTTAAYGFVFSQEFRNHNYCNQCYVEHLYQAFMGREADAAGLADWINKLNHGMTREEVFNGFAMSTEFHNLCNSYGILQGEAIAVPATGTFATGPCTGCDKGDGVGDFVTRLYQVCLDRNPDQAGKDDWCNKLWTRQTTGETTAFGFVFSEEFTNRGLDNSTFVDYMYKAFFGRNPDAAGKAYWLEQMSAGMSREDVFKGFTGSEEFFNLCGKYGIIAK